MVMIYSAVLCNLAAACNADVDVLIQPDSSLLILRTSCILQLLQLSSAGVLTSYIVSTCTCPVTLLRGRMQ